MVCAGGDRGLRHRHRANRLALRNPGTAARFGKILRGTGRVFARRQGVQIRNRDRSEGRQPIVYRSRFHHREGAMNQPHPITSGPKRSGNVLPSVQERRCTRASSQISQPWAAIWPDPPPAIEDMAMLDKQMKPTNGRSCALAGLRTALKTAAVLAAAGFALASGALAGEVKGEPRWKTGSDFSSLKDWNLKGENIVPHGVNPLYYPIVPGHKHAHERPDHPDGKYRKETVVLDATEDFDIPGIGKFKTAVVQEEEYLDGVLQRHGRKRFALDKTTNSVYAFGEVSWEIDGE